MKDISPFFYYSSEFPQILDKLNSSLVFSTYQAGKVIFISSLNGKKIIKYAKNYKRPMGIAYSPKASKLAIAYSGAVEVYSASESISKTYPEKQDRYSHLFIPQTRYYTGMLDTHDIQWGKDDLWCVNTMFSCLSTMTEGFHFKPMWRPNFITELIPDDKCHLNGLAMKDGTPAYATLFAQSNEKWGWKNLPLESGLLLDIENNKVLCDKLPMPHSPQYRDGKIYFLLSATGEVMCYDLMEDKLKKIASMASYLRGLAITDDYIIVGASKIRDKTTSTFDLPVMKDKCFCGVYFLDKSTGKQVAGITYTKHISEIFSVKILEGVRCPGILTDKDEYHDKSISVNENNERINYWLVQEDASRNEKRMNKSLTKM